MRWGITGTPGTGKTSATKRITLDRPIYHVHDILSDEKFHADFDSERSTVIVDVEAVSDWVQTIEPNAIIESHLAHYLPVDGVIVLRCHPSILRSRLSERNNAHPESIAENCESEQLDLILAEAIDFHGAEQVYEIDTTDLSTVQVAAQIEGAIRGEMSPRVGIVSYLEES